MSKVHLKVKTLKVNIKQKTFDCWIDNFIFYLEVFKLMMRMHKKYSEIWMWFGHSRLKYIQQRGSLILYLYSIQLTEFLVICIKQTLVYFI
ncbi:unnamed protein product [Paramecium sonneborni]|uniref:Uncharacterized protein n=1 Tax=Paramecium sonneborni TaxID=65129 RepID=A0A8S1R837_9CILI|nr:unnamed protein product [Paramecium sonneborni]